MEISKNIRKISGTKLGQWPNCIVFKDENGHDISKIGTDSSKVTEETHELMEGEEVIGVYGHKDSDKEGDFYCIGLIVWTPPF